MPPNSTHQRYLPITSGEYEHIARLQIGMHNASVMHSLQCFRHLVQCAVGIF